MRLNGYVWKKRHRGQDQPGRPLSVKKFSEERVKVEKIEKSYIAPGWVNGKFSKVSKADRDNLESVSKPGLTQVNSTDMGLTHLI